MQYKPRTGNLSNEEKQLINQLALITESGDTVIRKLLEATNDRLKKHKGEFVDVHDFAVRMGELLKVGESFSNNAGLLYDQFVSMRLNSPETIMSTLLNHGEDLVDAAIRQYEIFSQYIATRKINITIDKNSSDLLLLRKKVTVILKDNTFISENNRTLRLRRIVQLYQDMLLT